MVEEETDDTEDDDDGIETFVSELALIFTKRMTDVIKSHMSQKGRSIELNITWKDLS